MKNVTITNRVIAVVAALTLNLAINYNAIAACVGNDPINPGTDVACDCSRLSQSCTGPEVKYYGGYTVCKAVDEGLEGCTTDGPFLYSKTTPCVSSANFWGYAACALVLIGLGLVDLGVCFTAGVWTGGAACYAIIITAAAGMGAACEFCNLNDCSPSSTGAAFNWVNPSHASGGVCPPEG